MNRDHAQQNNTRLHTPVVFLIFKRPDTTAKVFAEIARARPTRLLVVADGPRPGRPDEAEQCAAARAIIEQVDWPCEVQTNYAETNMGLRRRVSSGITWAFEQVDEAIILEDDCVPHPTFFRFCEELLERYRDDERVMHIGGDNFQYGRKRTSYSYYFSLFTHCWGWATWKRAWQHYDGNMQQWPEIRDGGWLNDVVHDRAAVAYWTHIFQSTYEENINSWAYRWNFSCWMQNGLCVLPQVNLVTNIGFGEAATHTVSSDNPWNQMSSEDINFPLVHPPFLIRDARSDAFTHSNHFKISSTYQYGDIYNILRKSKYKLKELAKKAFLKLSPHKKEHPH
jgi:hypothetical protein